MATNQYLPFATAGGANVLATADYSGLAARLAGFTAGTALSVQLNTVWRQSSVMAAMIGELIGDYGGFDTPDDGNVDTLETSFARTLQKKPWSSAIATGTATALVITLTPAPAAYTKFMSFEVQVPSAAAGATTVNVNGLGAPAVVDKSGSPILPGFWQANDILSLIYDGTSFRVVGGQTTVTTAFSSSYSTSQALSNNVLSQSALTAGSAAFGAVASNAFTFTRPGSYNIAARTTVGVVQSAGNSNFLGAVQIRKNNVPVVGGYSEDSSFGNSGTFNREVNVTIAVAAGDAITLWAQCGASSGYVSASIVGMTIAIQALS